MPSYHCDGLMACLFLQFYNVILIHRKEHISPYLDQLSAILDSTITGQEQSSAFQGCLGKPLASRFSTDASLGFVRLFPKWEGSEGIEGLQSLSARD